MSVAGMVTAIIGAIVFFLLIISALPFSEYEINYEILLIGVGFTPLMIFMFVVFLKFLNFSNICRNYFRILVNYSKISISDFAEILEEDTQKVRRNIRLIIHDRYIEGIHYTQNDDCITTDVIMQSHIQHSQNVKKVIHIPVICESCSGTTLLPINSVGVCSYCGRKITSK